jgi:predicted dehydrogenase
LEIPAEASAEMLVGYDTGLVVSVHLDYVQRWRQRRCEVIGDRGTVVWESRRAEVAVQTSETDPPHRLGYDAGYDVNQMYRDECQHWLRCLERLDTPVADVQWAARVLQLALAAKDSAGRQQPVELIWDEETATRRS